MRWREREQRPDSVEAVPARIVIQGTRHRCIEVDSQQVIHRLRVLLATEPVERDSIATSHPRSPASVDLLGDRFRQSFQFVSRELGFVFRRHLTRVQPEQHLAPALRDQHVGEVARKRIELELALLLFRIMTTLAVLAEERQNDLVEVCAFVGSEMSRSAHE